VSDSAKKDTRWHIHDLPDDEILRALGRVAARHGFLNHVLIRTIKTLARMSIQEADTKFARYGNARLRELVEKHASQRLGEQAEATVKLLALLAEAKSVTEKRNLVVHALWARDMDSDERILIDGGSNLAPPTATEIDQLATEILAVATTINNARLRGFLHEALQS
jgi:hypothetical protein